jgi:hypothetical protein
MANPWFRMYSEFATDPKVQMLNEADQRRLTMLLCLRCNDHVTLHDEEVTFLLRISNDEWQVTKALFIDRGFINFDNEILNWDKRQFASDTSKNRVAAHRERKKNDSNADVTLQKQESNALDTEQIQNRTDTDKNKTKPLSPRALLEAENISSNLIDDWLKVRKAKNQPLTDTALKATVREASKAGMSLEAAITICCERSWAGFKAEYLVNQTSSKSTIAEQNKASTEAAKKRLFGTMPTEKEINP